MVPALFAAPPTLSDPNFQNSVVVMTSQEKEGTMGFIINNASKLSFHALLEDLRIKPKIPDRNVLMGGPLSKESGFVIYEHRKNKPISAGIRVNDWVSISPSREILEMAAKGKLPGKFELILGYAGWEPGQLEQEMSAGGWFYTPFFKDIVFSVPMHQRWEQTYRQIGVSPLGFTTVPGGAQA